MHGRKNIKLTICCQVIKIRNYVPPVVIPHSFSASLCFSCSVKSLGKGQFASSSLKNRGLNLRHSEERAWKSIGDRLRRPYYLSRVDHVRKIWDRKQRTDIGKYSFVNRTVKNWNQLPAEALGTFPCELRIFRNRARKSIINGVK